MEALHSCCKFTLPPCTPSPLPPSTLPRQADQANPALLFGLPLMLATAPGGQAVRVAHEGELASVTPAALLAVVCESLR
mgnify:CR=1 FL=1